MRLNYWKDSYPLSQDECPCDVHFVEYLERQRISNKNIFHFGTGEHHYLGLSNIRRTPSERNEILGVTASVGEYQAYMQLIVGQAELACYYKVMFADIYTLTGRTIPAFDLVTLFHLCEFYDPAKSKYAPQNDMTLLDLFLSKLNPEGLLFFYRRSMRFHLAEKIIKDFVGQKRIAEVDEYKTLLVCKPTIR